MAPRHRKRRFLSLLMAIGLVLVALLVMVSFYFRSVAPETAMTHGLPSTSVTGSATTTPSPSPQADSSATPNPSADAPSKGATSQVAVPDRPVQAPNIPAQADPVSFSLAAAGFVNTPLSSMLAGAPGSTLDPPVYPPLGKNDYSRNFQAYWLSDLGKPGTAATDTVYIIGHACSSGCWDASWTKFNQLGKVKVGDMVTITTASGDVHYRVTGNLQFAANTAAAKLQSVWAKQPGELRIISCSESTPGSGVFDQRLAIFATLVK